MFDLPLVMYKYVDLCVFFSPHVSVSFDKIKLKSINNMLIDFDPSTS